MNCFSIAAANGSTAINVLGLLGNVHCIAMCGGIVAAFSGPPRDTAASGGGVGAALLGPLTYNAGRVASYTVAGAIAGAAGLVVAGALGASGMVALRGLFGVLMIAVGLYVAGFGWAISPVEGLGRPLWRLLGRGVPALRPADRFWKALLLGAIWGWLPCGLVYGALLGAAASGSAARGALLMGCFGAGTLPALVAAGALAAPLRRALARSGVRAAAGLAVVVFGLWTLFGAALGYQHFGHAPAHGAAPAAGEHQHDHGAPGSPRSGRAEPIDP